MRSSSVFVVMSALGLATALSSLPTQVASAQPPSTHVVVPATGATVSSTQVVLDATASAGGVGVEVRLTLQLRDLYRHPHHLRVNRLWNSTHRGRRQLHAPERRHRQGSSGTTTAISITVSNRAPTMSFVLPALNGDNVSGTQAVFDAVGPAGVTQVFFAFRRPWLSRCWAATHQLHLCTIGTIPTIYGCIAQSNSTEIENGPYEISVYCGQCGLNNPPLFR